MTATSCAPSAFWNPGPLLTSQTSPQPMMPQRTVSLAMNAIFGPCYLTMIPEEHRRALDHLGFVQLPGALPLQLCARLVDRLEQLYQIEGDRAGSEFRQEPGARRLANLVD